MDDIAARLEIDPFDLRRMNAVRAGDQWIGGGRINSDGFVKCLESTRQASGWDEHKKGLPASPGKRRALGVACSSHVCGLLTTGAIVPLLEDGTVVLSTGAVDIGQGSDTVLSQICAEALQIPVERVALAAPDTDASPYNWGTAASRVTFMTGQAVVKAAAEVERKIKSHAADMLECDVSDLELRPGGLIGIIGVPQKEISFRDVSGRAHWAIGGPIIGSDSFAYDKPTIDPKRTVASGLTFPRIRVWLFNTVVCDVEVDEESGKTTVLEAWSACDVGKAINPIAVEGQIQGGFVQGLGFALFEEMVWDGPRIVNPSLMDYKIATTLDVPVEIHPIIIEDPEPDGPFGAKGIGEIPICAVAPAVANGITPATGVRFRQLPLTPERVLRAMLANTNQP